MADTLWLNADGMLLVDGDGNLILCDHCPCAVPDEFSFTCTDGYTVKTTLTASLTFSGVSETFPLTFDSDGTLGGTPNVWVWVPGTLGTVWKPCGDGVFDIDAISLGCVDGQFQLGLAGHNAAGGTITEIPVSSHGGGVFDEFPTTVVSTSPIHLVYNGADLNTDGGLSVGSCNGTDSILSAEVTY